MGMPARRGDPVEARLRGIRTGGSQLDITRLLFSLAHEFKASLVGKVKHGFNFVRGIAENFRSVAATSLFPERLVTTRLRLATFTMPKLLVSRQAGKVNTGSSVFFLASLLAHAGVDHEPLSTEAVAFHAHGRDG